MSERSDRRAMGDASVTPAEPGAALEVTGLTITAGSLTLVDDVSFHVQPQQRVGLIGASGSGKTLTCMAVAGLLPDGLEATGSVRVAGFDGNLLRAPESALAGVRGRLTGMVFQEPMTALNPTKRVDKQVAEVMLVHRQSSDRIASAAGSRSGPPSRSAARSAARARVLDLLDAVGLRDPARIANSYPHQLSGGQRQRVVLAIAMANSPELLICDEPTTALDVSVQARVLALIDERATALGSALLFVSHDLAVVASVCDYLLVMWQGRVVERGPVVRVLTEPEHEHTRQLLADADLTLDVPDEPAVGGQP